MDIVPKTVDSTIAVTVAAIENGGVTSKPRRVESPAEWVVENAIAGKPGIGPKPWVPVPAGTIPAGTAGVVLAGHVHIGLRQIRRTQVAEAIQVTGLVCILVELDGFQVASLVEIELVAAFHLDLLVVILHQGFALEHTDLVVV